jgi:hypothetical protein
MSFMSNAHDLTKLSPAALQAHQDLALARAAPDADLTALRAAYDAAVAEATRRYALAAAATVANAERRRAVRTEIDKATAPYRNRR